MDLNGIILISGREVNIHVKFWYIVIYSSTSLVHYKQRILHFNLKYFLLQAEKDQVLLSI